MKFAWIALAVVVGLLLLIALIGIALPQEHVAARAARFANPAEQVFAIIRDFADAATWRSDIQRVEMQPVVEGRIRYREHGKHGAIAYELVQADPPRRMLVRIADEGLPFGGTWTFELAPDAGGTELSITERGFVKNPIFRFLSRFCFSQTATIDGYLEALGRKLGQDVEPRDVEERAA